MQWLHAALRLPSHCHNQAIVTTYLESDVRSNGSIVERETGPRPPAQHQTRPIHAAKEDSQSKLVYVLQLYVSDRCCERSRSAEAAVQQELFRRGEIEIWWFQHRSGSENSPPPSIEHTHSKRASEKREVPRR